MFCKGRERLLSTLNMVPGTIAGAQNFKKGIFEHNVALDLVYLGKVRVVPRASQRVT